MTDLRNVLHAALRASSRPNDHLLHCSGHLRGSLRHAMLDVAGAPKIASEIVSDIRLMTGTLWHDFSHDAFVRAGMPFMQEIRLHGWLPEGWGGTADWLFWVPEARGFLLRDLKTMKGEGLRWIQRDGAKEPHIWQVSAYWHALYDMGFPLVDGGEVLYLPMNDTSDRNENVEPQLVEFPIIPRETVHAVMHERWALTQKYLASGPWPVSNLSVGKDSAPFESMSDEEYLSLFLTPELAPEQERVQGIVWNPKTDGGCFDVKFMPHWSAAYCEFPTALCGCSTQSTNKIGHYKLDGTYVPRKGEYESVIPMVAPSEADYRKRRKDVETAAVEAEHTA